MTSIVYLIVAIVALGALIFVLWVAARAYLKFRGMRLVTCPETREPAAVEVDAKHAAFTTVLGMPSLQVKDCSHWPERQSCEQRCLAEIELAPEGCLVRTILAKWYEGKSCTFCLKALGEINWSEHKPALMSPERVTFEWSEIHAERLPEVLATHMPVCWNCHIAETFRRRYPELVVYRPRRGAESHRTSK